MPKLIEHKHPYQLKNISSINEYLFLLKNILRIISSDQIQQKIEGISFPVRWSIKNNCWVVDFGSDKFRDIEGIHLNNFSFYYGKTNELSNSIVHILNKIKNDNVLESIGLKFNLFKNENRFLNFILCEKDIYFTGLYNRCQTKKRSGIYSSKKLKSVAIDDSSEFIEMVSSKLSFLKLQSFYNIKIDYKKEFKNFIKLLDEEKIDFKITDNKIQSFFIKDYFSKNFNIKKFEVSKFINCIEQKEKLNEVNLNQFFILQITLLFNNFVLKSLNSNKCKAIIVKDKDSLKNIKLVNKFNINLDNTEKIIKPPIMPLSF